MGTANRNKLSIGVVSIVLPGGTGVLGNYCFSVRHVVDHRVRLTVSSELDLPMPFVMSNFGSDPLDEAA